MDLVPVYAGSGSKQSPAVGPGNVTLTADQERAVRFETEIVDTKPIAREIHTAGRVIPDEALTYGVSAGVDGWVRRVFSDQTGTAVKRGETLASYFSKDSSAPQQAYVYALDSYERLKQTTSPSADSQALVTQQLATARDNLKFLGMGDAQIEELARTRGEIFDINITAPANGTVMERRLTLGQRFLKGETLYRIANLERVWVVADIRPGDAPLFGNSGNAHVQVDGLGALPAKIATSLPQFDDQGRTGRLRLEVNNSAGNLVPGMIVNVDIELAARPAITVGADAIIDSGTARFVFVASGDGQYEPRAVATGWQDHDRVEIRNGLKRGERVVTTGAFLLDSESRMKNPTYFSKSTDQRIP